MAVTIDPTVLTRFFIALLLLLFCAHVFGYLFTRLKMPRVVGEIVGGLILGPTVLGYFLPEFYAGLFVEHGELLAVIYWFGLVLLMFSSGFEIERHFEKRDKHTIAALVLGTTVIPLIFGWIATSFFDLEQLIGAADNPLALRLVITVALAITSIPVISKIFMDLGIIQTPFAKITLATATIHDVVLWVFVAVATGLVTSEVSSVNNIALHVAVSLLFFAVALLVFPRIISKLSARRLHLIPEQSETAFVVLILLLFTVVASLLEVNIVFGAFLAGIVVNYIASSRFQASKQHIKNFSMAFFVPLYFAIVGLKLDLIRHFDVGFFIVFLLFALIVQSIAVLLTARLLRYNWLSSFNLAVVLNDRGGPCIVLATLAFELGIISENFFVTLVLLAIVTSLTAGVWLKYVLSKGWELLDDQS